jgi:hypothetical protein
VTLRSETDGVALGGTLTLPNGRGPFPAVLLITGSGQQNRDEEIFDHRPFLVLADALTRRGIAVLRCDDRGVGASTGDPAKATSADFARDAKAELDWLRKAPSVNGRRVGLIGHSEGGLIASMLSPWFRFFLSTDPRAFLERVRCPVLALNGSRDLQVTPKENLAGIEAALKRAGNARFAVRELPGLNHLFQTAATGLVTEYGQIEQTLAPAVLQQVGDWILSVAATP